MFKTILVSLDGSALAEGALAPAVSIAGKFAAEVLLVRVVTPERTRPGFQYLATRAINSAADPLQAGLDEARAYLTGISLAITAVPVRTRVLVGAPPEMIVASALQAGADLIVMSTHGRTGLTRLLYGSVAEAVLRGSPVPVLLVPSRKLAPQSDQEHDAAGHSLLAARRL